VYTQRDRTEAADVKKAIAAYAAPKGETDVSYIVRKRSELRGEGYPLFAQKLGPPPPVLMKPYTVKKNHRKLPQKRTKIAKNAKRR
jgi:hypothetical protein